MIGAIIGDIIGSRFEKKNTRLRSFTLFAPESKFTDDTVCTIATMDWMNGGEKEDYSAVLARYVKDYAYAGFSPRMIKWAIDPKHEPYGSTGNGAAMRVSPAGWIATSESEVDVVATMIAEVSHNSKDGIDGAKAIADCIFLARFGYTAKFISEYITGKYGYDLSTRRDIGQRKFSSGALETVPVSIICFLKSRDFDEAARIAVSCGGDSDTIASMTLAIADAYYGTPDYFEKEALKRLPDEFKEVIDTFEKKQEKMWSEFKSMYGSAETMIEERKSAR